MKRVWEMMNADGALSRMLHRFKNKKLFFTVAVSLLFVASQVRPAPGSIITTATGGDPKTGYVEAGYAYESGSVFRGFIMFKGGFQIPTAGTIFYDADGPVYSSVILTSTLQLGTDLRLSGTGILQAEVGATIAGYGNTIFLGGDFGLTQELKITSSLVIDGCGHSLILEDGPNEVNNGRFWLDNRATLTLRNMNLVMKNAQKDAFLRSASKAGYVCLQNVNIWLNGTNGDLKSVFGPPDFFGDSDIGMVVIDGTVRVHGPGARLYAGGTRFDNPNVAGGANILINKNSTLYIGPGCILDLRYLDMPASKKIGMQDKTSVLWLDGCTVHLKSDDVTPGNEGLQLIRGTLLIDDKVVFEDTTDDEVANTDLNKGFIFGDGTSSTTDLDVRVLGGAYAVVQGCIDYRHS